VGISAAERLLSSLYLSRETDLYETVDITYKIGQLHSKIKIDIYQNGARFTSTGENVDVKRAPF
jgi:hypothetical protein